MDDNIEANPTSENVVPSADESNNAVVNDNDSNPGNNSKNKPIPSGNDCFVDLMHDFQKLYIISFLIGNL